MWLSSNTCCCLLLFLTLKLCYGFQDDQAIRPPSFIDKNEHAPEFQNVPYHLEVDELTPVGVTVFRGIHAVDRDKPNTANSDITYSIVGGNENNSFSLSDPIEGFLVVNKPLDYDNGKREFKLQIQASDHGNPSLSTVTTMSIRVKDADDQNPVFSQDVYRATVSETASITGHRIREKVAVQPAIHAFDLDTGINARLRYSIILGNEGGFFEMHSQTGELYLVREIDLETLPSAVLSLQIQATQVDNLLRSATARVDVFVADVNDNRPEFEYDMYNITVMENLPRGFTVLQVFAVDADKGPNAEFNYTLEDPSGGFRIDEKTGWISVRDPTKLDRETQSKIQMKVSALEKKPFSNNRPTTSVEINLLDANDNNPQFFPSSLYTFNVLETAPADTIVGSVFAHDNDLAENGQVVYFKQNDSISQNCPFDVHLRNGSVFVLDSFNSLTRKPDQFTFFVVASDLAKIHHERRTAVAVVRINVTDINNSVPEFVGAPYEAHVGESLPEGSFVTQIAARDADSINDVLEFSIIAGNDEKLFMIDSRSGKIYTSAVLDYEKKQSYDLLVQVSDGINTAVAPLLVQVVDINDQIPHFTHSRYNFSVTEELDPNTTVGAVLALDKDSGRNGMITYTMIGDVANEALTIDAASGHIRTRRRLDREIEKSFEFAVTATDGGIPQLSGSSLVYIKIEDINDNPPKFERDVFAVEVPEEVPAPIEVFQLSATDKDSGDNAVIKYLILAGNEDNVFNINPDTGLLTTTQRLNFESKSEYLLHVAARNLRPFQGPHAASIVNPAVQVMVTVRDINDELVVFDQQSYHIQIYENTPKNQVIAVLNATNPQRATSDQNIVYWIESGTSGAMDKFFIDGTTGELVLKENVDRDPPANEQQFKLRVFARDRNSINTFNTSVPVVIEVIDVNDNPPAFDKGSYTLELPESLPLGTSLPPFYKVKDIDAGSHGKIVGYFLNATDEALNTFKIDNVTGTVTLIAPLDYESRKMFDFQIIAVDGGSPPILSRAHVHIKVQDENDWTPAFANETFVMNVTEGPTSVGTRIRLPVVDYDDGLNRQMEVYIIDGNEGGEFRLDVDEGGPLLTIVSELDREKYNVLDTAVHYVYIAAKDRGVPPRIGRTRVAVLIHDINDTPPKFERDSYYEFVSENVPVGTTIAHLQASDADSPSNTNLVYSFAKNNRKDPFVIDAKTGMVNVSRPLDISESELHDLNIEVSDGIWKAVTNLKVYVREADERDPRFDQLHYRFAVPENKAGILVGRVELKPRKFRVNSQMVYSIVNTEMRSLFNITPEGEIYTKQGLDRERRSQFVFTVMLEEKRTTSKIIVSEVIVDVLDINDTPPKFEKDSYSEFVSESIAVGTVIAELKATDSDTPANTDLTYSFGKQSGKVPFMIDPKTGIVNVSRVLDISESEHYSLPVEVTDGLWKATTTLKVFLSEAEERDPRFDQFHYRFAVPENKPGVLVGRVELKPRKLRVNALMRYTIVNTEMRSLFNITSEGEIYTRKGLDREKKSQYVFTVMLEEKRPSTKITVSEVIVDVLDVNDEVPTFLSSFKGTIKENSPAGTPVVIPSPGIQATDADAGNNSIVHYFLSGEGSDMFTILDSGTVLFTPTDPSQVLDRESQAKYNMKVSAVDTGNLSSTTSLTIEVEDENDNPPVFEHGPLYVLLPEIAKPGSKVVQVKASDADEPNGPNSKIQFYITSGGKGELRMDKTSGEIFVIGSLRPGTVYNLSVSAVDKGGLAARTTVNVTVVDVNDHQPTFEKQVYNFEVLEGNYTGNRLKLGMLVARDEDIGRNGIVEYGIISTVSVDFPFSIDMNTGELFSKGFIDREARENYNFEVTATDLGEPSQNTSCEVHVKVKDVNDVAPRFYTDPYLAHVPENLDPGHKVTQIAAFDPDLGENGQVFYKLGEGHDNKFYIDGKDGTVWTLAKLDFEDKNFYNISIIAYDRGNPSLSSRAKLWVTVADTNDAIPDFSKAVYTIEVAENAKAGDTIFSLSAGEGPFKYSLLNAAQMDTFSVEASNGKVKLARPLDSAHRSHYRLVVKAEDDSEPPKFDTAEVNIIVGTGQGVRLFPRRVYEVTISENQLAPLLLIDLNCTDEIAHRTPLYSIVGSDYRGLFKIEPDTGRLSVARSLDRETQSVYNIKVKAESYETRRVGKREARSSSSRSSALSIPSSPSVPNDNSSYHLAFDEVLVVVQVGDENDNSPIFENRGRPIVAAVPLEAAFGFQVVKITAKDADTGINSAIRYEIVARGDDASSKFYVDPVSGIVRSMVSFSFDGGKLYGFDVKATDREGAESGNSAVTNVFVYVLPETRMVLFVINTEPIAVERRINEILSYLSTVTGFDVKLAKLEPHKEGDHQESRSTDLFLYAINHETNDIVDTDVLLDVFRQNSQSIVENLEEFKIKRIQGVVVQEKISQMGATEVAIIALSSIIFLGSVLAIALLCSTCKERKLKKRQTSWEQQRLYNIKNPLMAKSIGTPYGSRGIPNGHSSSTYSTGDGVGSEYCVDSLASYKRNGANGRVPINNKNISVRQQVPNDGSSVLNPPRSPRFCDRYRHSSTPAANIIDPVVDRAASDWFDKEDDEDPVESVASRSGFSRGSGRGSARSGYSGTSWSSRKSRTSPATEL